MVALPFVKKTVSFGPSGGYAEGGVFSSSGKYCVAIDASASPTIQVLVRNDSTGNYDTRVYPTGSGVVGVAGGGWSPNDQRFYVGASQGWVYFCDKGTGDTFSYKNGFKSSTVALRGMDVHPTVANIVATIDQSGMVRFHSHTDAGANTLLASRSMATFGEDVRFSPNGLLAASIDRNGNIDIFSVNPSAPSVSFLQRVSPVAANGWHLSWSSDSEHLIAGYNGSPAVAVFKATAGVWGRLTSEMTGLTFPAIGVEYISGGHLVLVQGVTAANWRVYERVGDTYVNRTADVTGYIPADAYDGRASKSGHLYCSGGATSITIHATPVFSDGLADITAELDIKPFAAAGSAQLSNKISSSQKMRAFGAEGEVRFGYVISAMTMKGFTATALVAAAAEDIIALRPIIMTAGASFVSGVTPNLTIDNTPDPFAYGTLEIASFTTEGLIKFPLEITDSYLQIAGFVTDGKIKFPIETDDVALVMEAFSVDGFIRTPDGQFAGEMVLEPFSAEGSVHIPAGTIGTLAIEGFATEGELRFGFKVDSELLIGEFTSEGIGGITPRVSGVLEIPAFEVMGLLMPPIKITGDLGVSAFTLDGEGRKDRRLVEAPLDLHPFTSDGEVFMPFGMRADAFLQGFNASGYVKLPYAIRAEMSMPKMRASGLFKRPDSIDANMSMQWFTHDGFIGFDLSNTAQLQLQQFVSEGEVNLSMAVEGVESMAPMEIDGELIFLNEVTGALVLGSFTSEGEIKLEYKINSDGTMRPFELDGYLELEEPEVGGSMSLAAFTLSGSFKTLMRRRQLRIVMDTV